MTAGVSELKGAAPPGAPNAKSGITRPNPFQFVIIGGIALIGALLIMQAYWPGVMIDDARWQYQQALDNAYENWHPPLMAWIWRKLTVLEPGPSPMLVLQLAFYWMGIALIASSAHHRGHPRLAFLLLCAGFLPAPFALSGTVTKDALMDGVLLFSTGMILWRQHIWSRVVRSLIVVLAIVGLAFAAALRFNAFFACIPLFLAAIPGSWIRTWPRFLAAVVGSALLFLAIPGLIAAVLHAEDTDVQLSLIIFDLGGITEHSKVSQFPDLNVRNPVAVNHHCYDPKGWDSYSSWAKTPCPLGFDPFQSLIDNGDVNAKDLWVRSILHHPIAYLEHRLTHFNLSTWFFVASGPDSTAWSQSASNPWGFKVVQNPLLAQITAVTNGVAKTPLGWPIFWIAVALGAVFTALSARLPKDQLAIASSAFLYGMGYLLVGVATGMRYYMWTLSGGAVAALLVAGEIWKRRSVLKRRWIIPPIALVALITSIAIAGRILVS